MFSARKLHNYAAGWWRIKSPHVSESVTCYFFEYKIRLLVSRSCVRPVCLVECAHNLFGCIHTNSLYFSYFADNSNQYKRHYMCVWMPSANVLEKKRKTVCSRIEPIENIAHSLLPYTNKQTCRCASIRRIHPNKNSRNSEAEAAAVAARHVPLSPIQQSASPIWSHLLCSMRVLEYVGPTKNILRLYSRQPSHQLKSHICTHTNVNTNTDGLSSRFFRHRVFYVGFVFRLLGNIRYCFFLLPALVDWERWIWWVFKWWLPKRPNVWIELSMLLHSVMIFYRFEFFLITALSSWTLHIGSVVWLSMLFEKPFKHSELCSQNDNLLSTRWGFKRPNKCWLFTATNTCPKVHLALVTPDWPAYSECLPFGHDVRMWYLITCHHDKPTEWYI